MVRIVEVKEDAVRVGRDVVLFVLGAGGIVHETVFMRQERPVLIVLFAAMVGMTGVIRGAEAGVSSNCREDRRNGT